MKRDNNGLGPFLLLAMRTYGAIVVGLMLAGMTCP